MAGSVEDQLRVVFSFESAPPRPPLTYTRVLSSSPEDQTRIVLQKPIEPEKTSGRNEKTRLEKTIDIQTKFTPVEEWVFECRNSKSKSKSNWIIALLEQFEGFFFGELPAQKPGYTEHHKK